jgi:hypothetical protein
VAILGSGAVFRRQSLIEVLGYWGHVLKEDCKALASFSLFDF